MHSPSAIMYANYINKRWTYAWNQALRAKHTEVYRLFANSNIRQMHTGYYYKVALYPHQELVVPASLALFSRVDLMIAFTGPKTKTPPK